MGFLQQSPPQSWIDVLLMPGLAVFFGGLVLAIAIRAEMHGKPSPAKWAALAILFVGLWMGLPWFLSYVGPWPEAKMYQADLLVYGRKMLLAHWGALLLPLLGIAATVVYQVRFSKRTVERGLQEF